MSDVPEVPPLEVHEAAGGGMTEWDLLWGGRVGPDDRPEMTYDEIGEILGISREMVRLIEQRALAKLRGEKPMAGEITQEQREAYIQAYLAKRGR